RTATALAAIIDWELSNQTGAAEAPVAVIAKPSDPESALINGPAPGAQFAGGEGNRAIPLSFAQHRLWNLAHKEPPHANGHVAFLIRVAGELNLAALERAMAELRKRHATLRTNFVLLDNEPAQVVKAAARKRLAMVE